MGRAFMHGWVALPGQAEVQLAHGVPLQVWVEDAATADTQRLADEIAAVSGLHVRLARWQAGAEHGERAAALRVDADDIAEVLMRLAHESAETFYERYRKPIDARDVDFDDEAYAHDFNAALDACGLHWGQIDPRVLRGEYRRALHLASEEIARHPE